MPPKPKFTKEEVAVIALNIVKEKGIDALTARAVGKRLGCSSTPIFTVFKNMDEVKWETRKLALKEFEKYASDFTEYTPAFKRIGMLMISYAINEPELYKLLFMQKHQELHDFKSSLSDLDEMVEVCINLIMRDYKFSRYEANALFTNMWIYTFGIGALCANKVCNFKEEEISENLSQMFAGMVMLIKSGKLGDALGKSKNEN